MRAHLWCSAVGRVSRVFSFLPTTHLARCIRSGCEAVTVDQRSMTEVPCVRLVESPMPPPMLSRARWRTVADLTFPRTLPPPPTPHHPPLPRDTYSNAPIACTRLEDAMHTAQESIEGRDTYQQLDLLGRAAVGLRRCRVGRRFALAAGVHGRARQRAKNV